MAADHLDVPRLTFGAWLHGATGLPNLHSCHLRPQRAATLFADAFHRRGFLNVQVAQHTFAAAELLQTLEHTSRLLNRLGISRDPYFSLAVGDRNGK